MVNGRTLVALALAGAVYVTLNCGQKSPNSRQLNSRNLEETTQTTEVPQVSGQPMTQENYRDTTSLADQNMTNNAMSAMAPQIGYPTIGGYPPEDGSGPFNYILLTTGEQKFIVFLLNSEIETIDRYSLELRRHVQDSIEKHLYFDRENFENTALFCDYRHQDETLLVANLWCYALNPGKQSFSLEDFFAANGARDVPVDGPNRIIPGGSAGPTYERIVLDYFNPSLIGATTIEVSDKSGVLIKLPFRVGNAKKGLSPYDLNPEEYDIVKIMHTSANREQYLEAGRVKQMMNEFRQRQNIQR